jgi:hypothetical protein
MGDEKAIQYQIELRPTYRDEKNSRLMMAWGSRSARIPDLLA